MKLLPLTRLGAHQRGRVLRFGLLLPGISAAEGYRVSLTLLHERDQFRQDIPPVAVPMRHSPDDRHGDYWSIDVDLNQPVPRPGPAWGKAGRYVYSYRVRTPWGEEIGEIGDPFAREFGAGTLCAITVDDEIPYAWSDAESRWRVPPQDRLVMYEVQVQEFAGDLPRLTEKLDYLADLGITALQLMPVSNVQRHTDWGYLPQDYFGVDERFGGIRDLQRMVDAAHQRGIAVVLDAVYGHTALTFPYAKLYGRLPDVANPFVGDFGANMFADGAASPNFHLDLTRDFYLTLNRYLLDTFHVDGFRYDCVPNYWDGPTGVGFANLSYRTYQMVKATDGAGHFRRFFSGEPTSDGFGERIGLIQIAEWIDNPVDALATTYSTSAWQNGTRDAAVALAHGSPDALGVFGARLGLHDPEFPRRAGNDGDVIDKLPLQYLENHDHSRLLAELGPTWNPDIGGDPLFVAGDRTFAYRLQPYLIGLLTARGIPLLWQGQEFAENYTLRPGGLGKVGIGRPVRWEFFSDPAGRPLVRLVRRLLGLRQRLDQLRSSHHLVQDDGEHRAKQVMVIERRSARGLSFVALNFSDSDQVVYLRSPIGGDFREELHGTDTLVDVAAEEPTKITIPSNYGRIWTAVGPH